MKNLKISILFLMIASAFIACKKDDSINPAPIGGSVNVNPDKSMMGKWVGKYGFDGENPNVYYCFVFHADSTLTEWNSLNDSIGYGTWGLSGTQFHSMSRFYPPSVSIFKLDATLDTVHMKITGTWGYQPSSVNGGKFYFIKQ